MSCRLLVSDCGDFYLFSCSDFFQSPLCAGRFSHDGGSGAAAPGGELIDDKSFG